MEKVKLIFANAWMMKLYKIFGYMVVEILTAQAFKTFLQEQISEPAIYGLAIIVIVQVAEAIKAILGEKSKVAKIL